MKQEAHIKFTSTGRLKFLLFKYLTDEFHTLDRYNQVFPECLLDSHLRIQGVKKVFPWAGFLENRKY